MQTIVLPCLSLLSLSHDFHFILIKKIFFNRLARACGWKNPTQFAGFLASGIPTCTSAETAHTHTHTLPLTQTCMYTKKPWLCKVSPILWGILAQLHRTGRDLCASGAATLCAWRNWRTAWWTRDQKGHSASTCWTQWPERRVWKTEKHCCHHPETSLCN